MKKEGQEITYNGVHKSNQHHRQEEENKKEKWISEYNEVQKSNQPHREEEENEKDRQRNKRI